MCAMAPKGRLRPVKQVDFENTSVHCGQLLEDHGVRSVGIGRTHKTLCLPHDFLLNQLKKERITTCCMFAVVPAEFTVAHVYLF